LDLLVTSDENGVRYLINEGNFEFRDGADLVRASFVRANGVAAGDCDGDGDVDVFVTEKGTYKLLINDGSGTLTETPDRFQEYADAAVPFIWGSSIFFDADGDDDLDLWVGCYDDGWSPHCPD